MKILVVDDEKIILQGIVRLLKSNPLVDDVYWAEDAFIALDFLKGHQVDAVVTDIRMPEMDGLELIRIAREEELCDNFIILSGFAEFKYAQQAISYQVTEYILKPVDPEELDKAVRDIKYKTELRRKTGTIRRILLLLRKNWKKKSVWKHIRRQKSNGFFRIFFCCRI